MKRLSDLQKIEIVNRYLTTSESPEIIAKFYNVSGNNIRRLLSTRGVVKRPSSRSIYKTNTKYFEEIDTQYKAYFLGLLYADGYNNGRGFSINLQECDKEILERFKEDIEYNGELKELINKNKRYPNLSVYSKKISLDLNKLGCVKAKSKILTFPNRNQVPDNLINHFIRGYFDGDGSLSKSSKGRWQCSICSTSKFNERLIQIILSNTGAECKMYKDNNCHESYSRISFGVKEKILKFLNWIYKGSEIHLTRKYNKYLNFCEEYNLRLIENNTSHT